MELKGKEKKITKESAHMEKKQGVCSEDDKMYNFELD